MPHPSEVLNSIDFQIDPKNLVRDFIIPKMDERRGRTQPMTSEEIVSKLLSIRPQKPGEAIELIDTKLEAGTQMTAELASEIADIWYYSQQPNCPAYLNDPTPILELLGIDSKTAAWFCVVKYQARIMFGDDPNYKEIEYAALNDFLSGPHYNLPIVRGNLN